jgi:hypothetical protein
MYIWLIHSQKHNKIMYTSYTYISIPIFHINTTICTSIYHEQINMKHLIYIPIYMYVHTNFLKVHVHVDQEIM